MIFLEEKKKTKTTIRNKFAMYNSLLLAIVLIVSTGFLYYFFNNQFFGRFRDQLMNVAQTATILIDVDKHEKLKSPADENSRDYKDLQNLLKQFQQANNEVQYIYTMRLSDKEGVAKFIVDTGEGQDHSHIGDDYDISKLAQLKKAFEGQPTADTSYNSDQWGSFLSGYAPLKDKEGNTVAIVGVDMKVSYIRSQQLSIVLGAGIILIVIILVSSFGSRYLAGQFFKPVALIKEEIEKMRRNKDYQLGLATFGEYEELVEIINSSVQEIAASNEVIRSELKSSEIEKNQFYQIYSNLIKSLSNGKLRLATPKEIRIYLTDGAKIDEVPISKEEDKDNALDIIQKFASGFDGKKFEQIQNSLVEAIDNVIKHAQVGTMIVKNFDGKLRFVISDKGPGMSMAKLPHNIFINDKNEDIPDKGFSLLYKSADYIIFTSSKNGTVIVLDFAFNDNGSSGTSA